MSTPGSPYNRDNFCYRHPDRISFTLCQRCLRTVCGECQTQAAVGVVCPDCMKGQAQQQTPAQRKAERRWKNRNPVALVASGKPVVTYALLIITAVSFVINLLTNGAWNKMLMFWAPMMYPDIAGSWEPWRLLTSILVHSSFTHLAFNMLALWMIGRLLEPVLGRSRFLVSYLLCAVGGSVAAALLDFMTPVVGASGAIFGLFGLMMVLMRHQGLNIAGIAVVLGINLVIGFIPGMGISWQTHVGGLVIGALIGVICVITKHRRSPALFWVLMAVIIGVELGLLAWAPTLALSMALR